MSHASQIDYNALVMSAPETNESRVAVLEEEGGRLRRRVDAQPAMGWLARVAGSFAGEPEFDKVLEQGRAIRQANRPDDAPAV